MSSFFSWMGGKSKVAKRLAALLPDRERYVEVFAGAANLLFVKDRSNAAAAGIIKKRLSGAGAP